MSKLYYVETGADDMLVAVYESEDLIFCRYAFQGDFDKSVEFPSREDGADEFKERAMRFLKSFEDVSGWEIAEDYEDYESIEDWLGIDYYKPDTPRIIAQIDIDDSMF